MAVYFGYRYTEKALKSSQAYTAAVAALKQNKDASEKLGEIKNTGFPIGSYSENTDGTGKAAFTMSVEGTKASGRYSVTLTRRNSVWQVEAGILNMSDGTAVQIEGVENDTWTKTNEEDVGNADWNSADSKNAVSGGVLNSKAISLPEPSYPPIAKAAKASGSVIVQVVIDENGNVISARAVSGHPLLQSAAVAAARKAKFPPRKVSGKPVKVTGTIVYKFAVQ